MKNIIKSIVIGLIIITLIFIFSVLKNKKIDVATQVKKIQDIVQVIDSEKNYQTKTLNNEKYANPLTDGGAQLVGFLKDGKTYKISESLGLSYGVKSFEYYFSNNQLILVNQKEEYFPYDSNKESLDYSKLEPGFEGYYYFNNEKIIMTQTRGEKRYQDAINVEQMFLKTAKENLDLLSK